MYSNLKNEFKFLSVDVSEIVSDIVELPLKFQNTNTFYEF